MIDKRFTNESLLWLKTIYFFKKPIIGQWILSNFGSIKDFIVSTEKVLLDKGWPRILVNSRRSLKRFNANNFINQLNERDINLVCIEDEHYPPLLKIINNPPPLLFYRGNFKFLWRKTVSIVGSRKCTEQGRTLTRRIASLLAENGYTIVSGLANGIDTAAHQGALGKGSTAAILGCGLDICFPAQNAQLFGKIPGNGCLISEHFWTMQPFKHHFPYRNRIISGLSEILIIIEAGEKSGALITANLALEQGREVLAVPGKPTEPYSKGCNSLIKDGAFLIDEPNDLTYFFDIDKKKTTQNKQSGPLLDLLKQRPLNLDELAATTKESTPSLLAKLTKLEIEQLIAKDEQNKYFLKV